MTNEEVALELESIADLLEIAAANTFRIRSFRRAAEVVADFGEEIATVAAEGRLTDIAGIGKGIAAFIEQLIETGTSDDKEALLEEYPESLLELLRISGFGPKKVALVFRELNISTVDALEEAATAGQIRDLPGMGKKTEENILKGIDLLRQGQARARLGEIVPIAEELVAQLREHPDVKQAEYAGSTRRCRETIGDLDLLATSEKPAAVCAWFAKLGVLEDVTMAGDTKVSGRLPGGRQVDLRVVEEKSFGAALQYFTGSQQHNIRIRERAQRMGLTVNEYGVFEYVDEQKGAMVAGKSEEDVYAAVELPWIAPELREDRGEIAAAENGELPKLIEESDIRGDLHVHSTWSDGHATIEEMARAALAHGYEYLAITDHSESLAVANGLDAERYMAAHEEVMAVQEKLDAEGSNFVILHGTEADIRLDGSLDIPDGCYEQMDFVICSIHQGFSADADRMTERMVKAVESGMADIVAHPTGRILLAREAYGLHFEELVQACAKHDVALEINASPMRLDLNDVHSRYATEHGCKLVINSDAHKPATLGQMRYGVMTARRGWTEAKSVLNTWTVKKLRKWFGKRRG